jgi:chemotaxis protein CheX
MSLDLVDDDLAGLADAIWCSILGSPAEPAAGPARPVGRAVTSCVHISGDDWNGSVSVALPWSLALEVAATMFGLPADELSDADVLDAVGELANIAGGNVKGMLEGPADLSLPVVAEGIDFVLTVPGAQVTASATMVHAGTPFAIQIHERV